MLECGDWGVRHAGGLANITVQLFVSRLKTTAPPIKSLLDQLRLTRDRDDDWGIAVRGTKRRLEDEDMEMIAEAMGSIAGISPSLLQNDAVDTLPLAGSERPRGTDRSSGGIQVKMDQVWGRDGPISGARTSPPGSDSRRSPPIFRNSGAAATGREAPGALLCSAIPPPSLPLKQGEEQK